MPSESTAPGNPWEYHDELPPLDIKNASPESDRMPTPSGQFRCYFNGELMYSLSGSQFSVGFETGSPGPLGLTFTAPVTRFEDDPVPEPRLETDIDQRVPIREVTVEDALRRKWVPADEVSWEFEIVLERTPYDVEVEA